MHCRRHHTRLVLALVPFLLALPPRASWGGEAALQRLSSYYHELQEAAKHGPFGLPLQVRTEERQNLVSAEVHGIINHPLDAFGAAVAEPVSLRERQPKYVTVSLSALQGLLGTKAHQLEFEAASVDGRTVVALRSSYEQSAVSKLATAIYLATVGRDKVGFSRERVGPDGQASFVRGAQGMIERNLMRYYLVLKAFLDTRALPDSGRFEARISTFYDLMERYPAQLHEMERAEYLDVKRRERQDQIRLQQTIGSTKPQPTGP